MVKESVSLKQWRLARGWSQEILADKLTVLCERPIGQTLVSAYERGVMPGWDVGEAIRKITGGKVKPESFARK